VAQLLKKSKSLRIYKCSICEQLGQNSHGFKKKDGTYYVEAHHVEPVTNLKQGNLSINNLITVCANHHRELHYENSVVLVNDDKRFVFEIDGKKVEVKKINI